MPVELRPKTNPTHVLARVRLGSGSTPSYTWDLDKQAMAEAWHEAAKKAIKSGASVPDPADYGSRDTSRQIETIGTSWTLQKGYESAFDNVWRDSKNSEKMALYWKEIAGFFGASTRFDQIDIERIEDFVRHLRVNKATGNPRSNATINRYLSCISVMWKNAHDRSKAPARPRPWPKKAEDGARDAVLSPEEEKLMFTACKVLGDTEIRDYLIMLLDTGMRRGELESLTPANVASPDLIVLGRFSTKNDTGRSIPLSPRAQSVVAERVARTKNRNEKLFPLSASTYRHRFDRVKAAAELPDNITMHTMRHTFASRLARTGEVTLLELRDALGHKSLQATQIYAHLCTQSMRRVHSVLANSPEYSGDSHL